MTTKHNLSDFVKLSNAERNVYLLLSYAALKWQNSPNFVDASSQVNELIREQTGMHDVTRRAAISALVKAGFIERTRNRGTYRINGFDWSVTDGPIRQPKTRKKRTDKQ
jgi:hypothetical protein